MHFVTLEAMSKITLVDHDLPNNAQIVDYLSLDTETMGLNFQRDRLCLVQVKSVDSIVYLIRIHRTPQPAPNLTRVLLDRSIAKICHYARFDIGVLYKTFGVMANNIFCTKIASRLVRTYSDRHGLKELCRALLGIEINKGQQASDWGSDTLNDAQQQYAAGDVLYLADLREKLEVILQRESRMDLFQACCDFLPTRIKLDLVGWPDIDIFAHH